MPEEQPEPRITELFDKRLEKIDKLNDRLGWVSNQIYVHEIEGPDKTRSPIDLTPEEKIKISEKVYDAQANVYLSEYLGLSASTDEGKGRITDLLGDDSNVPKHQFVDIFSKTKMGLEELVSMNKSITQKLNPKLVKSIHWDIKEEQLEQLMTELTNQINTEYAGVQLKRENITRIDDAVNIYLLLKAGSPKTQFKNSLNERGYLA